MERELKGIKGSLIIKKYKELNSVWKVGEYFNLKGQEVHKFLNDVGQIHKLRVFTEAEKKRLLNDYVYYRNRGELSILAKEMGRTKQYIARQARALGLTSQDKSDFNYSPEVRKKISQATKDNIKHFGHPKGMLGKKHTEETKSAYSSNRKRLWQEMGDKWLTEDVRRAKSDRMKQSQKDGILGVRSRCYMFDVTVGEKKLNVKSTWEYDMALYLQYLLEQGYINSWEYEPVSFDFPYDSNGVRSYRPDFKVRRGNRDFFIEVKGWEDDKSKLKQKLMEQYYPCVKILYVSKKTYGLIKKKYKLKLNGFGKLKEQMGVETKKCGIEECNRPHHSKGLCRHHFYEKYNR